MPLRQFVVRDGKVSIISADSKWTAVISGITVASARAASPTAFFCEFSRTYAPGGSPLAGTFTLTHEDGATLRALNAIGAVPSDFPAKCVWGYYEYPAATMLIGHRDNNLDMSMADVDAYFFIMLFDRGTGFDIYAGVRATAAGIADNGEGSLIFTNDDSPFPCDLSQLSFVDNLFINCAVNVTGKGGQITISRCV